MATIVISKERKALQTKVTNLRDKKQQAWAEIGAQLGIAPRTARRVYDELNGAGAHHGLLDGKGGRRPVVKPEAKPAAKKPAAKKATTTVAKKAQATKAKAAA